MSFIFLVTFVLFLVCSRCSFFFLPSNHFVRQNLRRTERKYRWTDYIFFIFFSLIADEPYITILPVVTKDLPISPWFTPYIFLSRCKFSTLTNHEPMVEFYLLTFPRFPLRKKEHKSYFGGKNRTHDFRTTSRCAG